MDIDTRWAAGFFDGEGCVAASRNKKLGYHTLQVSVGQNDLRPLKLLQNKFGGKLYERGSYFPDRCINWVWNLMRKEEIEIFLLAIRPYLIVKGAVTELALEFVSGIDRSRKGIPLSKQEKARRRSLGRQIQALNKRRQLE